MRRGNVIYYFKIIILFSTIYYLHAERYNLKMNILIPRATTKNELLFPLFRGITKMGKAGDKMDY